MIDRPFEEVSELFGITCDMTKKKMDKYHWLKLHLFIICYITEIF